MDAPDLGASLARPTGHSRGLGTAASIVGAPRWRISPPSEIQRSLIKDLTMKSYQRCFGALLNSKRFKLKDFFKIFPLPALPLLIFCLSVLC